MPDTTSIDMTAERERVEAARIERELSQNRASLAYLNGQADDHDSRAIRMRQLAAELVQHVQPLRTLFTDLRQLHTPHTWEGRAATASRLRLDEHEIRHNAAVQRIDHLIDDLEDQARWHAGQSTELDMQIGRVRSAIWTLEQQRR